MAERISPSSPYARCVELLFSGMDQPAGQPLLPQGHGGAPLVAPLPQDWPPKPPPLEAPDDLQAAYAWFRAERHRLDEYTRGQLAYIQQEHINVLGRHYQNEAEVGRRVQEVNREI